MPVSRLYNVMAFPLVMYILSWFWQVHFAWHLHDRILPVSSPILALSQKSAWKSKIKEESARKQQDAITNDADAATFSMLAKAGIHDLDAETIESSSVLKPETIIKDTDTIAGNMHAKAGIHHLDVERIKSSVRTQETITNDPETTDSMLTKAGIHLDAEAMQSSVLATETITNDTDTIAGSMHVKVGIHDLDAQTIQSSITTQETITNDIETTASMLGKAGIHIDAETTQKLPPWETFAKCYGQEPIIQGLETCQAFRDMVPAMQRNVAAAGMHNSGTNLLAKLLKDNCRIRENHDGMLWQVPWGKHSYAHAWNQRTAPNAEHINKTAVLSVITIRDPYEWMSSTCHNPYVIVWDSDRGKSRADIPERPCPALVHPQSSAEKDAVWVLDTVKHASIADMWNDWHEYYRQFMQERPALRVRLEDLVLRPKQVIEAICHCAGGELLNDESSSFQFATTSAKAGPGHGPAELKTDSIKAWQKLARRATEPRNGYLVADYDVALASLDPELMKSFGYHHPVRE
jgi:hypothetical protein